MLTSAQASFVAYRLVPRYYYTQILNSDLLLIVTEVAEYIPSDTRKSWFAVITNIDFGTLT
jgi:hypothetical protein